MASEWFFIICSPADEELEVEGLWIMSVTESHNARDWKGPRKTI